MPLFSTYIGPGSQLVSPLLAQLAASPLRGSLEGLLQAFKSNSPELVRQLAPLIEQLVPIYADIARGRREFIPSTAECTDIIKEGMCVGVWALGSWEGPGCVQTRTPTRQRGCMSCTGPSSWRRPPVVVATARRHEYTPPPLPLSPRGDPFSKLMLYGCAIAGYGVERNLLVQFTSDGLDDSDRLTALLTSSSIADVVEVQRARRPGTHLRPLQQDLGRLGPEMGRWAAGARTSGEAFLGGVDSLAGQAGVPPETRRGLVDLARAAGDLAGAVGDAILGAGAGVGAGPPSAAEIEALADECAVFMGLLPPPPVPALPLDGSD